MTKTITLKAEKTTLIKELRHIDEQLECITDGPIELMIGIDAIDEHVKTMEILFDRISIERIKKARLNWREQSIIS